MNHSEDLDDTVVVNTTNDETVIASDETVAIHLSGGEAADDHTIVVAQASPDETVVVASASPMAPPVLPTAPPASPTAPPWQIDAPIERGVSQALPVRYPARPYQVSEPRHGLDEVQRRIGAAPAASPVAVRQGREGLPSLERRTRRGRMVTLILFGVVLLGSLAGLWVLASIAFGW